MSAFDTQVDGNHYKDKAVQPVQLAYAVFGGDTCACKIAKYLTREKDDWGKQIDKAQHVYKMFLEMKDSSPVKELDLAQQILLLQFVQQEPEGVQTDLALILTSLVMHKNEEHVPIKLLMSSFNAIREYYVGDTDGS